MNSKDLKKLLAGLGVVAVFWLDVVGYTLSGAH